jgi:sulfur carrier protein ThiS
MSFPDGYNCELTLGEDNANNAQDTSLVVANENGSVLERLEYVQAMGKNIETKVLTTIANGNTTVFNYTGSIKINSIIGRVTTVCEAKGTNTKLAIVSDALTAVDICANVDLTGATVGTLLSITGTTANAMVASANGAIAPGQANPVVATCTTSGIIRHVSGAANTGAVTWYVDWEPLSEGATLTAA